MPVSWELYLKIRKINLKKYVSHHSIKSYEELLGFLNKKDVILPTRSQVEGLFSSSENKNSLEKKSNKNSKNDKKEETNQLKENKDDDFSFEDLGAYDPIVETQEKNKPEEKLDIPERKPRRRRKKTSKKSSSKK